MCRSRIFAIGCALSCGSSLAPQSPCDPALIPAVQLNERSRTYQVYGAVLLGISPKVANRTCSSRWYAEHWHSDDRFKSSGAWRTKKTQKEDLKSARVRGNEVKLRPKRLIVNFGHPRLIIPLEGTTRGYFEGMPWTGVLLAFHLPIRQINRSGSFNGSLRHHRAFDRLSFRARGSFFLFCLLVRAAGGLSKDTSSERGITAVLSFFFEWSL
jgi:hypothetical protein